MFNGKMKAVTFSYDDGIAQDIRLIELLNKYNLKFLNRKHDKKLIFEKINLMALHTFPNHINTDQHFGNRYSQ